MRKTLGHWISMGFTRIRRPSFRSPHWLRCENNSFQSLLNIDQSDQRVCTKLVCCLGPIAEESEHSFFSRLLVLCLRFEISLHHIVSSVSRSMATIFRNSSDITMFSCADVNFTSCKALDATITIDLSLVNLSFAPRFVFFSLRWGCREHFVSRCWHSSGRDRGRYPRECWWSTSGVLHPGVPVMWYDHIRDMFPTAEGCMGSRPPNVTLLHWACYRVGVRQ